jgi:hypothetical protein
VSPTQPIDTVPAVDVGADDDEGDADGDDAGVELGAEVTLGVGLADDGVLTDACGVAPNPGASVPAAREAPVEAQPDNSTAAVTATASPALRRRVRCRELPRWMDRTCAPRWCS